jgi:hypothetical protein
MASTDEYILDMEYVTGDEGWIRRIDQIVIALVLCYSRRRFENYGAALAALC